MDAPDDVHARPDRRRTGQDRRSADHRDTLRKEEMIESGCQRAGKWLRGGKLGNTEAVTLDEVRRVAELANLELTAEEEPRMQRDLNAILGHIAELNQLDTKGVPAMAQVGAMLAESAAVDGHGAALRDDAIRPSAERTAVMAAAPETDGRFFKVPKVIER